MKLIDADALDAEMYHKSFEVDDGRNVWNSGLWIRYKIFEEAIRDAPTIDAEPVRHAKWEDRTDNDDHYVYCSECGDEYIENDLHLDSWVKRYFKYCPNCGARMDEE